MPKTRKIRLNQIVVITLLTLGALFIVLSAFYGSSYLAILGLGLIFWGGILLYITPTKHVPLTFLTASTIAGTSNIERVLSEQKLTEKGVYLPPKNLQDPESSLIFIPETAKQGLPLPEETAKGNLLTKKPGGLLLTPPGAALSKLFENELGVSFIKTDLNYVQNTLPKLLIERMEIAEDAEMTMQEKQIILTLKNSILDPICEETKKYPKTHDQVGCLLSSAIACVLAKASGKAVTIKNEEQSKDQKTTKIELQIMEE